MSFKTVVSFLLVLIMILTNVPSAFAIDAGTQQTTSSGARMLKIVFVQMLRHRSSMLITTDDRICPAVIL